jgi:5-methylcytosine-specific restriction endonuclease McrA
MPLAPKRYCAVPGCSVLVERGRCAPHAVALEHTRPNRDVRKWYYTLQWSHLRKSVLTDAAYTCAECGQIQLDLDVDHIVKHEGDPTRFWNRANLQALCKPCHSRKTVRGE